MWRLAAWSSVALAALTLAFAGGAQQQAEPSNGEVLVREMVSVTGTLRLAPERAGRGSALEVDSGALGQYVISEVGLGEVLKTHLDEDVTVLGYVEPFEHEGRPVLRVASFTLHQPEG